MKNTASAGSPCAKMTWYLRHRMIVFPLPIFDRNDVESKRFRPIEPPGSAGDFQAAGTPTAHRFGASHWDSASTEEICAGSRFDAVRNRTVRTGVAPGSCPDFVVMFTHDLVAFAGRFNQPISIR